MKTVSYSHLSTGSSEESNSVSGIAAADVNADGVVVTDYAGTGGAEARAISSS